MTVLTHTARTLLRSRVRRHPDAPQHLNGKAVADLTNADLVQIATAMGLDVPGKGSCDLYNQHKGAGKSGAEAIALVDQETLARGAGGPGMLQVTPMGTLQAMASNPASGVPAAVLSTDADENTPAPDDADTLTDDRTPEAPAQQPQEDDADLNLSDAEKDAKAKDIAAAIRAKLGTGDFAGFDGAIVALAHRALTPKVVKVTTPAPVYVDPSKVKGTVPKVVGRKTMRDAGINVPSMIRVDRTTLDVYDAPDAPAIDPDYIWPEATPNILAALSRSTVPFLYGPAGTGKTTFVKQVAARWGRPYVRVSCNDQTEASTLVGMTVPDGPNGVKWQDGQLAAAIRRPGTVILIDEPSIARPGALFVLQALMDDERAIHVDETGEVIRAAPGVLIVLADNTNGTGDVTGAYEATRRLNRATLDRAAITVRLDYLPPAEEAKALMAKVGCTRTQAAALVKFANVTRAKATDGHVSHGIGFRRLVALGQQIADGADPSHAFQLSVIETSPHDDREPLRQLWTAEIRNGALK
jgi:nitric oxide reductase NorQ protein